MEQARVRLIARYAVGPAELRDENVSFINTAYQILANPEMRRAYDAGGSILCPYCGHVMPREIPGWQHLRLHSGVTSVDPEACSICRRKPTAVFSFQAVNREDGKDTERGRRPPYEFVGPLCRLCSFSLQRGYQLANYGARRPGELASAARYLPRNRLQSRRRRGLAFPDTGRSSPSPRKDLILQLVGSLVYAAAVILVVTAILVMLQSDRLFPGVLMWLISVVLMLLGYWIRMRIRVR
jgi:hypothetical protein